MAGSGTDARATLDAFISKFKKPSDWVEDDWSKVQRWLRFCLDRQGKGFVTYGKYIDALENHQYLLSQQLEVELRKDSRYNDPTYKALFQHINILIPSLEYYFAELPGFLYGGLYGLFKITLPGYLGGAEKGLFQRVKLSPQEEAEQVFTMLPPINLSDFAALYRYFANKFPGFSIVSVSKISGEFQKILQKTNEPFSTPGCKKLALSPEQLVGFIKDTRAVGGDLITFRAIAAVIVGAWGKRQESIMVLTDEVRAAFRDELARVMEATIEAELGFMSVRTIEERFDTWDTSMVIPNQIRDAASFFIPPLNEGDDGKIVFDAVKNMFITQEHSVPRKATPEERCANLPGILERYCGTNEAKQKILLPWLQACLDVTKTADRSVGAADGSGAPSTEVATAARAMLEKAQAGAAAGLRTYAMN